jgi:hypothetical protein
VRKKNTMINNPYRIFGILLVGALAPLGMAQTQTLDPSWQKQAFPDDFSRSRTFPSIQNGNLVSFSRTGTSDKPNSVVITSLDNGHSRQVPVNITAGSVDVLLDAGLTPSGDVLLGGQSAPAGGAPSGFLSKMDQNGKLISTVNTGSFMPARVCAMDGGSVWTLGQTPEAESTGGGTGPLLRNYDDKGKLRGAYLERSALGQKPLVLYPAGTTFGTEVTRAYLSCGDKSVGVYVGAPFNTWTEVDAKSGVAQQMKVTPLAGARMTGMVILKKGATYGSFQVKAGSGDTGLYQLTPGPSGTAKWVAVTDVAKNQGSGTFTVLMGRHGDSIVHLRGHQPVTKNPVLNWSKLR